jgi:hypothetical protein
MKIIISEKQYKRLIKNIDEQDATAGTTTPTSGGQGYPEVGKWESGVTRGPGNQIGLTKWSDIVGSLLKRDKANKLK